MDTADRYLLDVAAHEAGHAVIWRHAGFKIASIRIWGSGSSVQGCVSLADAKSNDPDTIDAYLIGMMAGEQASLIAQDFWDFEMTPREIAIGCRGDYESFAKTKKYERKHTRLSRGAASQKARSKCNIYWKEIDTLARQLLRRKGLTVPD